MENLLDFLEDVIFGWGDESATGCVDRFKFLRLGVDQNIHNEHPALAQLLSFMKEFSSLLFDNEAIDQVSPASHYFAVFHFPRTDFDTAS